MSQANPSRDDPKPETEYRYVFVRLGESRSYYADSASGKQWTNKLSDANHFMEPYLQHPFLQTVEGYWTRRVYRHRNYLPVEVQTTIADRFTALDVSPQDLCDLYNKYVALRSEVMSYDRESNRLVLHHPVGAAEPLPKEEPEESAEPSQDPLAIKVPGYSFTLREALQMAIDYRKLNAEEFDAKYPVKPPPQISKKYPDVILPNYIALFEAVLKGENPA